MSIGSHIAWDDTVLPFQLDRSDIRGRVARLDDVLTQMLRQHNYPPAIEALVCEAVLLTALIGQTIKLRWKLSLQIRGDGPARLVATDYFAPAQNGAPAQLRAYAGFDQARLDPDALPFEQVGQGYFAILIDQGEGNAPYQGITPIAGGSLASCAETYFAQSEQLPTRFATAFGKSQLPGQQPTWRGGAIMLQKMPGAPAALPDQDVEQPDLMRAIDYRGKDEQQDWRRANVLLDKVEPPDLIGPTVQPTELLVRLFQTEGARVFDATPVSFGCTCSANRVRSSLSIYSASDIAQMTTDTGVVTADCQFCGAHYEMDPATLGPESNEQSHA